MNYASHSHKSPDESDPRSPGQLEIPPRTPFSLEITLPIWMRVGWEEKERQRPQEIRLELVIHYYTEASVAENLTEILDYATLVPFIESWAKNHPPVRLLETSVYVLGKALFKKFPLIKKMDLKLSKVHLPGGLAHRGQIKVGCSFVNER